MSIAEAIDGASIDPDMKEILDQMLARLNTVADAVAALEAGLPQGEVVFDVDVAQAEARAMARVGNAVAALETPEEMVAFWDGVAS